MLFKLFAEGVNRAELFIHRISPTICRTYFFICVSRFTFACR
nr:MAG TPA: hypothetical protein [Caudoviricetes sp.]